MLENVHLRATLHCGVLTSLIVKCGDNKRCVCSGSSKSNTFQQNIHTNKHLTQGSFRGGGVGGAFAPPPSGIG